MLITVRILPVGFDSSDGSSAGTSAEGECAVWCSTLAVPREQLCQGSVRSCHWGQEQCCAPHGWGWAQGTTAQHCWWLQGRPEAFGAALQGTWVSCAVLGDAQPQRSSLQWGVMVLVHPSSPGCPMTWGHRCAPHPGAKLQLLCCIKKPLLKFWFINDVVRRTNVMEFRILQIS